MRLPICCHQMKPVSPQPDNRVPASLRPGDMLSQPLSEARTLPAYAYAEPAFHVFDLQHIFAVSWQPVGRADQVREVGDHIVAEIAGRPVVAVRGNDGVLRGFFNVCKHRAGPLALVNGNASITAGPTPSKASCARPTRCRKPRTSISPVSIWTRCVWANGKVWYSWRWMNPRCSSSI